MILNRRTKGLELVHCAAQVVAAVLLYLVWMELPWSLVFGESPIGVSNYTLYGLLATLGLAVHCYRARNQPLIDLSRRENLRRSSAQTAMAFLFIVAFLAVAKDVTISRLFLFSFLLALFFTLLWTNGWLPHFIGRILFGRMHQQNTLLLGRTVKTREMRSWVESKRPYGIHVVGTVLTDDDAAAVGHPHAGRRTCHQVSG